MPFEFPNSPTNGQYYNGFVYNAANQTWDSAFAPRPATVPISSPNYIINGGMDIWQRGTSGTVGGSVGFAADRWQSVTYAGGTMFWFQQPAAGNPGGNRYCLRIQRASGATNTASMNIAYSFETSDVLRFAGKTVTWSFYARAGATYSPAGSALAYAVIWGTGTDQSVFGTGFTGGGDIVRSSVTLTTSWQRYTITVAVPANATSFAVNLYSAVQGTAGVADYYEFTGAQLEEGAAATDFRRAAGTLEGELSACQRYYEKTYAQATTPGTVTSVGFYSQSQTSDGNGNIVVPVRFATPKRVIPTMTAYVPSTGASGNWTWRRSGTGGTALVYFDLFSEHGGRAYLAVGAAYAPSDVDAHWVANAEL